MVSYNYSVLSQSLYLLRTKPLPESVLTYWIFRQPQFHCILAAQLQKCSFPHPSTRARGLVWKYRMKASPEQVTILMYQSKYRYLFVCVNLRRRFELIHRLSRCCLNSHDSRHNRNHQRYSYLWWSNMEPSIYPSAGYKTSIKTMQHQEKSQCGFPTPSQCKTCHCISHNND